MRYEIKFHRKRVYIQSRLCFCKNLQNRYKIVVWLNRALAGNVGRIASGDSTGNLSGVLLRILVQESRDDKSKITCYRAMDSASLPLAHLLLISLNWVTYYCRIRAIIVQTLKFSSYASDVISVIMPMNTRAFYNICSRSISDL